MNLLEKYKTMGQALKAPSLSLVKGNTPSTKKDTPDTLIVDVLPTEKQPMKQQNLINSAEVVEPGESVGSIWRNHYPQGTPEARRLSLELIIEAMLYGLLPMDDEQTRRIHDMARDVLSGLAKLADLRCLLRRRH
jgi:hypothetical protein